MESGKQFDLHKIFVISAIVVGVGFFLFSLIFTRVIDKSEMKTTEIQIPEQQQREAVLETPEQSTVQSLKLPSKADIEAAIAALENMDTTESRDEGVESSWESSWDEENSETPLTDSLDETPLSYEEKLAQQYFRISKTTEWKEANHAFSYFPMLTDSDIPTTARKALSAFHKSWNNDEFDNLPPERISQELERLKQEADAETERNNRTIREYNRNQADLHQRRLDVLGMTNEEFEIAVAEYRRLSELGELDRLRKS